MSPKYVVLEKPIGQTPLATLDTWRLAHPAFTDIPATYAGRLDPMASGKLLMLLGDECKKREQYTNLDKEYEIEVVLDLSTDTGDALGLPSYTNTETDIPVQLRNSLAHLTGAHSLPYPAFSSKTVQGKPLFVYALEGTIDTISVPVHLETIYRISLLSSQMLSRAELQERIDTALVEVPRSDDPGKELGADFRQDVIRAGWRALMGALPERTFAVIRLRVTCGSGAYMRTLARRLAHELGTDGFALSIRRTKIGTYKKLGPFGGWVKKYT